jgi:hypothetical protein
MQVTLEVTAAYHAVVYPDRCCHRSIHRPIKSYSCRYAVDTALGRCRHLCRHFLWYVYVHVFRHEIATDNDFNAIKDQAVGSPKIIGIPIYTCGKGLDYTRFELF